MIPVADEGYLERITGKGDAGIMVNVLSPSAWVWLGKKVVPALIREEPDFLDKYTYDIPSFQKRLDASWEEGPPELLSFRE